MKIRSGATADVPSLTAIHDHYVRHSHATFDERCGEAEERLAWFAAYAESGPYRLLVAEEDRQVVGYATSSKYREHPAFRETVETSVYVSPGSVGRGVGTKLYEALFASLRGERLHLAVAGIALPNPASIALHRRFGFREVGVFHEYAVKNGRRISSLWLEKPLVTVGPTPKRA